ncbi:norphogenetic protein [Salmonella enterica]|nr:norphogenetic protein [Salmonella enterica]
MLSYKKPRGGDRVIIVASGPSAAGFVPPRGVPIIAVNGAIDWLSRASYFFTLDPSRDNMRRLRIRRRNVNYCSAGAPVTNHVHSFERVGEQGPEPHIKGSPEWWLWRWSAKKTLSEDETKIHNGNSAWGALGLAHHLGFKNVALVGVDATQELRVHTGGIPNNLSHLPLLFRSALPQINVVSCGKLNSIPQMSLKQWLKNA